MSRRLPLALALWLAAGAAAAGDSLFLWEVQAPKARHYLVGSVHLLPPQAYPLPSPYDAAYEATEGVVFESDIAALASPELQGRLLAAARDDRAGGLKARLRPALYQKLVARTQKIGMPVEVCEGFKPWFCALTLELFAVQRAGFDPQFGVDQHFFDRATEDNRPIGWLEAPEVQARFFSDMEDAMAVDLLAATLDEATDTAQEPEALLALWQSGDLGKLEELVRQLRTGYPKIHARLFADRNRAWMPRLRELLRGDTPQLVVVGAAHYAGPQGLLTLLKAEGISAQPVSPTSIAARPRGPAAAAVPAQPDQEPVRPE